MLLTGQIWQGLLLILGHMFIVGNEDNILRPKLVPKEARLDPALTMLSVFSGLAFFGFLGIVLGPVIMIVIVTTIEVYLEVYKNVKKPEGPVETTNKILKKLKFWNKETA
jgi:predicted PurR-regulated permease PerM